MGQHKFIDNTNLAPWQIFGIRMLVSVDQLANVLLLGFPDETVSGRLGRAIETGRPKKFALTLYRAVNWFFLTFLNDPDHCENAIESEERFNNRPELWRWYHSN